MCLSCIWLFSVPFGFFYGLNLDFYAHDDLATLALNLRTINWPTWSLNAAR